MNNKVKLAIAVAVGLVGGGLLSTLGGGSEVSKNTLLGSNPVGDFQNGQEMVQHLDVRMERFRDVLVDQSVELLEELELINLWQSVISVLSGLIWMNS